LNLSTCVSRLVLLLSDPTSSGKNKWWLKRAWTVTRILHQLDQFQKTISWVRVEKSECSPFFELRNKDKFHVPLHTSLYHQSYELHKVLDDLGLIHPNSTRTHQSLSAPSRTSHQEDVRWRKRTSWNEHNSIDSGSWVHFSFATELVISLHLASTAFPFFSCLTWGWMHKFLRDDKPIPRKSPSSKSYTSFLITQRMNSVSEEGERKREKIVFRTGIAWVVSILPKLSQSREPFENNKSISSLVFPPCAHASTTP